MALTSKELAQARAFLFQNGERPAKGVPVSRWVEEFATVAMDHGQSFSQTLIQIRRVRETNGKPTNGDTLRQSSAR